VPKELLTELSQEDRAKYIAVAEAYQFEHRLSHYFAMEISKALYKEEILEIHDFLEKLLHKTNHEEETE
jgi:hypothetical protein